MNAAPGISGTEDSASLPFDRVLCAIDGTEESLDAAFRGWCLAPGRPLTLLYIVDVLDAPAEGDQSDWVHEQRRAGEGVLGDAREQLLARGVDSEIAVEVYDGTRPEVLRDLTVDGASRLLTMGSGEQEEISAGPTLGLAPPAVDRLTRRVLDVAGCSVLVSRLGTETEGWPQSITVGVDGSPVSSHAYETAAALAQRTGGTVTAVTAIKHRLSWRTPKWLATAPDSVQVVKGEPADAALIKMDWHSDLVVVGRTGSHRSRGMGTTSEKVAAFSAVPVLVVHRAESA